MSSGLLNKKFKSILSLFIFYLLFLTKTYAHCPLCVAGAGAAGGIAIWLGVAPSVVALFIGAFSVSIGLWMKGIIKKKYIPYQEFIVFMLIYLSTIFSMIPFIGKHIIPIYISWFGEYGGILHNTYSINLSWLAAIVGSIVVFVSPLINKKVKEIMGWRIPFQNILITFIFLISFGLILQFLI